MKRFLIAAVLVLGLCATANAQPRAIGGTIGYGIDFSYQNYVGGQSNMIDLAVGLWGFNGIHAACNYDWIFPIQGGWNWYVGPGAGVGFDFAHGDDKGYFALSVGGQIGVEYNFNIPLNLSLDYRPMINVLGFNNGHWGNFYGVALGIRYRF